MFKYYKIEDIKKNEKLEKQIIGQINRRYDDSESYMSEKRRLFQTRYKKFTNPADSETDKIKIHLLYQHLKAFISTYYTEGLTAGFTGKEFLDDDYAYMLETCYNTDIVSMGKKQKDFFHIMNIGFYGVSLLLKDTYDNVNQHITYKVVSPEYWLPDRHGNLMNGFRYHMFDFSITKSEIDSINAGSVTGPIYIDVSEYGKTQNNSQSSTDNKKTARALGTEGEDEQYHGTRVFFEREGIKYVADLFNSRKVIGRLEIIQPVSDDEKKNPHLIPFPVEVVNCFPLEDDPCGVGLAELILSFQNAKNRLMNMALRKEERNSGFQLLLADISKIQDIDLLAERPTDGPIIVPFNGEMGALNGDVVRPVIDGIKADQSTINLANILDVEAQGQTGFTSSNRGLPFGPDVSLGEAKMQQVNSNLIFSLDSECISRGEVGFVKNIWLRGLKENLPANIIKYARIGNGIASNEVTLSRKQMQEHGDPDINVESKKDITERNKQKLDYLMAEQAFVLANPDIPAVSKSFFMRDIRKYRGIPREEIYRTFPLSVDEKRAIRYIKQINAYADSDGKTPKPESLFYNGMDLWTYYIYLQKAKDCDLKKQILAQIDALMIKEGINKTQQVEMPESGGQEKMEQVGNSMSSQLVSNVAQQSGVVNNYPTRADVLGT